MTREELAEIFATLPAVRVRWGTPRDLKEVLAIERATGGPWGENQFRSVLLKKNVVIRVAECVKSHRIRGFAVYENEPGILYVVNMACADPVARRSVIETIEKWAEKMGRVVAWKLNV